jgi:transketolase
MRTNFAKMLFDEAIKNPKIMLLTGDLGYGVWDEFKEKLPRQFINCGVAEQTMIGIAGGLSSQNKKVFVYSIANFPTFRCLEQIRNDLVYMENNVSIVSVGAGFAYGPQGYTHHGIEDISIMRCLGNLKIYSPADKTELEALMPFLLKSTSTTYLRLGKGGEPALHTKDIVDVNSPILTNESNKDSKLKSVYILSCGPIGYEVNEAVKQIEGLYNYKTFSVPVLDPVIIKDFLLHVNVDLLLTIEEHVVSGGFGSMILEILSENEIRLKVKNIGIISNNLKQIGSQKYLRSQNKLDSKSIADVIKKNL